MPNGGQGVSRLGGQLFEGVSRLYTLLHTQNTIINGRFWAISGGRDAKKMGDGICVLKIESGEQSKIWVTGCPKIGQFSVPKTPLQMAVFGLPKTKSDIAKQENSLKKKTVLPNGA